MLRAHLLSRKAQDQLAKERDERARDVIEKFQWITAGTVFANPFPALELVANGAVQFQMISELAGVYGVQISTSHVRMIGGQMIQMLLKLGLVETATSLIAGIFKSTLVGYAAAGGVQAVSMAYLTHISGEAFAEYFRAGQTWGDGGMQAALIRQFDLTSRAEFLQEFAKQAVQKVSTPMVARHTQRHPNSPRPRSERSRENKPHVEHHPASYPRLFPEPDQTIAGIGRALREGRTTCVEILEGCLAQVDEWEPKVHAWVVLDREGAIEQARALDDELKTGKDRGPLHGIPIGIKDIIDVAGLPTACGSKRWADRIAESDANVVASLREAGAVIMGKTVTTPYAWIDPPITRNPWNLERTPGGSSSGSAAAVACGMCFGAIGTQTGGSITRPASFCGVAGMKPSKWNPDQSHV